MSATSSDEVEGIPCEIDGQDYYIEEPNPSHSRPYTMLKVWDATQEDIGRVKDYPHIKQWLSRHGDFAVRYRQAEAGQQAHEMGSPEYAGVSPELSPTGTSPRIDSRHVQVDAHTAQCMYFYNATTSPHSYTQTQPGMMYPFLLLACATPVGMIPMNQLSQETDFNVNYDVLSLNPANIRRSAFQLTRESPDRSKRVVVAIPTLPMVQPVQLVAHINSQNGLSEFVALYFPTHIGMTMPAMSYHTDIFWTELTLG